MAIERMPITPEVVTWARERLGYKVDALATKRNEFKKLTEWESGDSQPTYRQLELLAKDLWVPVAVFFFPAPPQLSGIEETFRTMETEQFDEVPPRIRLLLHKARAFQVGLAELNDGRNPARRLLIRELSFKPNYSISFMAAQIREFLGVSLADQFEWLDDSTALKAWRSALFDVGVTVFKDAFKEDDYCGFSLFDDEFPVIYVNNSNTKTRQVFTLFHELAHLLFHTSGMDKDLAFRQPLPADKQHIEATCNRLAAEILVPEHALNQENRDLTDPKSDAGVLALKFGVSREVIFRRFRDRQLVTNAEYAAATQEWHAQRGERGGGGGNFYRTKIAYLGEEYISLALRRFYENRIDDEELADYLDVLPKNLERLEDAFFQAQT